MDSGEDERNGTAGTKLANVTWSGQREETQRHREQCFLSEKFSQTQTSRERHTCTPGNARKPPAAWDTSGDV